MSALKTVHDWRHSVFSSGVLTWLLAAFVAGFLVAYSTRGHRDFLYFLVFLPSLCLVSWRDWKPVLLHPAFIALFALIGYALLSQLWSESGQSGDLVFDRIRWAILALAFVGSVAVILGKDSNWPERFLIVLVPALYIVFVHAWLNIEESSRQTLHNTLFYHENPIRGSVGIALVGVVSLVCLLRSDKQIFFRILGLLGVTSSFTFLFLAESRGLLLALFVSSLLLLALKRCWWILGVAVFLAVAGFIVAEYSDVLTRSFIDRGSSRRFEIWLAALERIAATPLFGEGLNSPREVYVSGLGRYFYSAHNIFLVVAIFGGLVGLCLLVNVYGIASWTAIKVGVVDDSNWLPFLLLVFGCINLSFVGHELIYRVEPHVWLGLWFPLGAIIGADVARKARQ